jgi:hypothetical protein
MKFFLFLLLFTQSSFSEKRELDFFIKKESQLRVSGDASIINFICHLKNAFDMTPFKLKGNRVKELNRLSEGKIIVPIENLDCGQKGINEDMKELLKAEEFPEIILDFKELAVAKWKKEEKSGHFLSSIFSKIEITLAGVPVVYPVHLNLVKIDENNILASGSKKLKITDFNLKPKAYLFGLVKIKELIEIDFELVLTK